MLWLVAVCLLVGYMVGTYQWGIYEPRKRRVKEGTPSASHNRQSMPNYACVCGYWMSTIEYRKGRCPSCGKVIA